jgi:hypothetical protein
MTIIMFNKLWSRKDEDKFNRVKGYKNRSNKMCTAAAAAKSLQSCLTLCDPIDGSPPGSPIPGILEWVAISFSNEYGIRLHLLGSSFMCFNRAL